MISDLIHPLFLTLAVLMAAFGCWTVCTKHILRSAIYLMTVLFLSAGIYLILGAEFLAGAQILIYVGGIIVLLVFAVMLTQSADLLVDRPSASRKILGALGAGSFFAVSVYCVLNSPFASINPSIATENASISALGKTLIDTGAGGYALPFEVISILLLAVLIGGSVIARKDS